MMIPYRKNLAHNQNNRRETMGRVEIIEKLNVRPELAPHVIHYEAGKRYRYMISRIEYTVDMTTDERHVIGDFIMGYRVKLEADKDGEHQRHPDGQRYRGGMRGEQLICGSDSINQGVKTDPCSGLPLGYEMVDRNSPPSHHARLLTTS
jgi:hypothetical protein